MHTNLRANLVSWILIIEHAKAIFLKLEYRYFIFYVTYSIDGKETYKIISFCNTSLNVFFQKMCWYAILYGRQVLVSKLFFPISDSWFSQKGMSKYKDRSQKSWIGPIVLYSIFLIHTNSLKCCSFEK